MNCSKCGTENSEAGKYCQSCGASLARGDSEPMTTSVGLNENVAALLCYALGWVTGLIFILLERESEFVRFHAMQSIVTFGALSVIGIVLGVFGIIPFIGILFLFLSWMLSVLAIVLWILLMIKAYQGERYKLLWAGDFAEKNMPRAPQS